MHRAGCIAFLICAACARNSAITSNVPSDRSVADAKTCSLYRLQSLGYTVTESQTPGGLQGVREIAGPPRTVDRIDVFITPNSEKVAVGRPNNTFSVTMHTLDTAGKDLQPSGQVQADGINVSTACARQ